MLKAFRLVACTVLFSVACFTPLSRGRSSRGRPTPTPRTSLRATSRTSPPRLSPTTSRRAARWTGRCAPRFPASGSRTSRPGSQTVRYAWRTSARRTVINPWLTIGPIDFFSQQTIADSVVEGLSTDREKALAIFYFYITHRYHKGNGDNGAQGDVSQAMNVFGFNTCGNSTLCMSDLLDKVGMRDCIFSHCPGHCRAAGFFRRQVQHAGRGHGHDDAPAGQPHAGKRVGFGAGPRPDQTRASVWNHESHESCQEQ